MDPKPPLYAQFDGDEVDGKFYGLGEVIDRDRHSAQTIGFLETNGRISATKPADPNAPDASRPVASMSRAQLLAELADGEDDDSLREAVERRRERVAEDAARERDDSGKDNGDPRLAKSIPKIKAALESETNLDTLRELHSAESKGQNRAGALDAIDDRIRELSTPDYERDGLKDLNLDEADKDRLLVIAAYEGAEVPQGDEATEGDLRAAILAKRG